MKPALLASLLAWPLVMSPVAAQTPASAQAAAPTVVTATANTTVPAVAQHYAAMVHATYSDTLASTLKMQQAIEAFLASPSQASLSAARQTWLDAREFYGQTEAFRFYGGPIDDKNGPEGRMNAWPMDESYVDSVNGSPNAGIINNPKINKPTGWSAKPRVKSGGVPRPSCAWQPPQDRAMKCGPKPSRAVVEAGACTQLRLKKELPMTKRVRSTSGRLASGKENALRPVANTVVSPPVFSSSGAGAALA